MLSFAPFIISKISVTMVSIRDLPCFVFASLAYTIGYRSLCLFATPTEKYFTLSTVNSERPEFFSRKRYNGARLGKQESQHQSQNIARY